MRRSHATQRHPSHRKRHSDRTRVAKRFFVAASKPEPFPSLPEQADRGATPGGPVPPKGDPSPFHDAFTD